ncbi:NAD-dependent epimerase/dehydratase family protein [Aliishimia ponticola]|uniref:NAD-dependent epimerase/dehydratase family protein n=1 Tax=Aliishimia ponticola TaxID=2499833 RepID=A0A4S4NGU7_9RHOB|nr:NAD-dependent epimerase/dehydratase family protein [Aliishimia ponticola]THH38045.1 NAD-dependent epimerase/dehydratase family protein [Aliishimia ponticola]
MKIAVLGGDGFCGWPSALHLAADGHEVTIIDNLSRRAIGEKISAPSLTPISSISERIEAAKKVGNVNFIYCDIAQDPGRFKEALAAIKADVIVHFAEQRAAPYSMLGDLERRYTIDNNVTGTNNLMSLLVDLGQRPHIVHLGTMGVYGYNDDFGEIPEGYLDVTVKSTGKDVSITYPGNPGSIYHLTKVLDHQMMQFYAKNWGFQITDLHQGIVWGTETEITKTDPALMNRFDYDGEYGTVLNRMISQAQVGFPLTVYGTGGQSRAFIHIQDTARCIALAATNPPEMGERPQVFNQVSEVHTVRDLAQMIAEKTGVEIGFLDNPRKELAENKLMVSNEGLRSLGFEPIRLDEGLVLEIEETVGRFTDRLDKDVILSKARW